jgi:hypothetical protein
VADQNPEAAVRLLRVTKILFPFSTKHTTDRFGSELCLTVEYSMQTPKL